MMLCITAGKLSAAPRELRITDVRFSFSSSAISVEGLASGEAVAVYTYGGQMVARAVADNGGSCTIDAGTLPRQPLIVKTSKTAYKIILR